MSEYVTKVAESRFLREASATVAPEGPTLVARRLVDSPASLDKSIIVGSTAVVILKSGEKDN